MDAGCTKRESVAGAGKDARWGRNIVLVTLMSFYSSYSGVVRHRCQDAAFASKSRGVQVEHATHTKTALTHAGVNQCCGWRLP